MARNGVLFAFGFVLILAAPAFAQSYPMTLYADQSAAAPGGTVKFTVTWLETSVVKIDFTKVEFQYKKISDGAWTTFSATEGTSERLNLVLPTRGGSGTMREFTVKLSGAIGSQTTYQFRMRDKHYPDGSDVSAPVTVKVSSGNVYGAGGSLKIIPGSGYRTSGAADAYVKIKEGNQLGTGFKITYDFSVDNAGGSGQNFLITVISNDATLSDSESDRNSGTSIFRIVSITNPDGTVVSGSGNSITLLPGTTTLRMEVDAPSDIAPRVNPYRVVTFRATNIDAQRAGQNVKAEASARVTADTIRDCVDRLDPTVSVSPPSKSGDPGQTLIYTVTIKNQDTGGCEPRTVSINKIGLQQLLPPASDYDYVGEAARRDDNGMKWGIVLRGIFGGKTTDVTYRQSGTFTEGFTDYVSFSGSGATFKLAPADASGEDSKKVMILRVTSYVGETKASQRGVRVCTSDGCGAQSAVFDLQNPFDPNKKPSQAGEAVSDSVLTDPDKNIAASPSTGGTGGTVGVPLVPVKPPQADLDPAWVAKCKACAVRPNMGFNTDSQTCVEGDVSGSGKVDFSIRIANYDGKYSTTKNNWIFLPTENSRQIVKDTARKKNAYTCEKPPKGVGLSSSSTSATPTTSPTTTPAMSDKPSYDSCLACVKQANKGYASATGKCEAGTSLGSKESSASVSSGNWVYFSSDAIMNSVVTARPDLYSKGLSCEKLKQTTTTSTPSSTPTTTPTMSTQPSFESCLACVKLANKGYVSTTGKCESGTSLASSESSASFSARNWVYFSSDAIMASVVKARPDLYSAGLSCEVMKRLDSPTTCSSWTFCSTCTQGTTDSCGWDKTAGACKKGTDQRSDDESASLSKNNWIWYNTENDRGSSGGLSCEKSITSTAPTNPSSQPSLQSCLACVKQANKGYASATGKCEAGTSLGSKESSASVSSGNWVYFSSDAIMNSVVTARPDLYSKGLSCYGKFPS